MIAWHAPHGVDDGSQGLDAALLQRHMHGRMQLEGRAGVSHALRALVIEHPPGMTDH